MGKVVSQLLFLNDIRAGFEAEDRLADMQSAYLGLLESRNQLQTEVKVRYLKKHAHVFS